MMVSVPRWLRSFTTNLESGYRGVAQDIDSVKHMLRGVQWRLDSVINHFEIPMQPDVLESVINPSQSFINEIVTRARFAGLADKLPKSKKRRKPVKRKRKVQ